MPSEAAERIPDSAAAHRVLYRELALS